MLNRELVASAIKDLPQQVAEIADAAAFVDAWSLLEFIKGKVKEIQTAMETAGIEFMKAAGLREIEIGPEAKIILTEKKKEIYDTEGIYKALAFTEFQIAALPKNPSWRKNAILAHPDTAGFWSQEIYPDLEIKKINPVMIDKIMAAKKLTKGQ